MRPFATCCLLAVLFSITPAGAAEQDCIEKVQEWVGRYDSGDRDGLLEEIVAGVSQLQCDDIPAVKALLGNALIPLSIDEEAYDELEAQLPWILTGDNFGAIDQYFSSYLQAVDNEALQDKVEGAWNNARRLWLTPDRADIALQGWTMGSRFSVPPGEPTSLPYKITYINRMQRDITRFAEEFGRSLEVGIRQQGCGDWVGISELVGDTIRAGAISIKMERGQECAMVLVVSFDGREINEPTRIPIHASEDEIYVEWDIAPEAGVIPFTVDIRAKVRGISDWSFVWEGENLAVKDSVAYDVKKPGTYQVGLRANDPRAQVELENSGMQWRRTITAYPPARFRATPRGGLPGVEVSATNLTPRPSGVTAWWTVDGDTMSSAYSEYLHEFEDVGRHDLRLIVEYPEIFVSDDFSQEIIVEEQPSWRPVVYGAAGMAVAGLTWLVIRNTADDAASDAWRAYEAYEESGSPYEGEVSERLYQQYSDDFDSRSDTARNVGLTIGAVAAGYTVYSYFKRESRKEEIRQRYARHIEMLPDGGTGFALLAVDF